MKPQTPEIWPPPPVHPEQEIDAGGDDWLTATDLRLDVTRRDYAVVVFAVLWLLLACIALAAHHHLPLGAIKNVPQIIRTVLP